jgi:tRNA (Thr-GGU) A37 N-methylase
MSCPVCLKPIGVVEVGLPRRDKVDRFSFVSVIKIFDEYVEGLKGLRSTATPSSYGSSMRPRRRDLR